VRTISDTVDKPEVQEGSVADEAGNKKEFDALQQQRAGEQNMGEGGVPEQRPIASQQPAPESGVRERLIEAGDQRGGAEPPMDKSAYDRAASKGQAQKAAKESQTPDRLYPGARGYIDNPGAPDHGRAIAVNGVASFASVEDERISAAGGPNQRFAKVAEYECVTRDGRAELMIVSADHVKRTLNEADWGKTPLS
jgi:hypothetical protein